MSRHPALRSRVGERVEVRDLRVGERVNVAGSVGVVTFFLRGSPFVRWIDAAGREGEPLVMADQVVEVVE